MLCTLKKNRSNTSWGTGTIYEFRDCHRTNYNYSNWVIFGLPQTCRQITRRTWLKS
jgi:hypothetical protein